MNRTLAILAMMGFAGTIGVSAQMKHVDLTDAKGNNVGMVDDLTRQRRRGLDRPRP